MTHAEWSADRETLVGLLTFLDQPWLTVNSPAGFTAKKETVRFVAAGVLLRELRSGTPVGTSDQGFRLTTARAIRVGGSLAMPSLTLPSTHALVGSGTLVITDRRVVVCGEANREWRFDKLVRVQHDQGVPDTWLQVGNRRRVSGWQGKPAEVPVVRFALARAVAESQGGVHALRIDLLEQLRQHDAAEPAAAVIVASTKLAPSATTAPVTLVRVGRVLRRLYTGRPGAPVTLRLLQGLGVSILTLALLGSVVPDQQVDVNVQSVAGSAGGSSDQREEEPAEADAAAGRAADKKVAADEAAADKAAADQAAARDAAERAAADRAAQQAMADQAAAPQRASSGGGCTPEYPDFCIPAKAGDAYNCADFDQKRFTARQPDPYGLDRNKDGVACES